MADSWHTMELEDKVAIMKDLVSIEKKLLSISFTWYVVATRFLGPNGGPLIAVRYGSLYYTSDAIKGSVAAEVVGDASPEVKNDVSTRFTIGPTVEKEFWSKERSEMNIDRGPCMLQDSLLGIYPAHIFD